ncbi:hypothetical protein A7J50_0291 [Pseudomonas antarctica]|uniref:Uncharacterized protein n=1 Tax=Pseudomonas antarctica TaxID=219572 RepID=A0A172YUD7_9PSED|nr:hypothetical protein [Pseudomonas antarctica]ANF83740.1 hypothetical protein A7J50_0291 [Pseudomonas antarctica]
MKRYHSWICDEECSTNSIRLSVLVICYNSCILEVDSFYKDIEESLKRLEVLPDCVYFVGNSAQLRVAKNALSPEQNQREILIKRGQRYGTDFVKVYNFFAWDGTNFVEHSLYPGPTIEFKIDGRKLFLPGLLSLIEENNVVHLAPSGHSFKHPSGNINKLFIQSRELASNEAQLYVLGYALAAKYFDKLISSRLILIDTMGIYSVVKTALQLVGGSAEIQSFHSYENLALISEPDVEYFCVISASTSGSMARKLVKQNFKPEKILTLIDISDQGREGGVLIPLSKMSRSYSNLVSDELGTLIELIGENFTSKAKPPKSVTVALKHNPDHLGEILKKFGLDGVLPLNSMTAGKSRLIELDASRLLTDAEFSHWLDIEINWSVSMAINCIVYCGGESSRLLAELALQKVKSRLDSSIQIHLVSQDELSSLTDATVTGVLVVSAVVGDGGGLRDVSRDLRNFVDATIPRHFIAAVGLPQTEASWGKLTDFLTRNPTSRKYGFSNWLLLPIGYDGVETAWRRLGKLSAEAEQADPSISGLDIDIARNSLDMVSVLIENNYHSFLPKPDGEKLDLSHGFLFFEAGSEIAEAYDKVSQSAVYLTMTSVLQKAREHKDHAIQLKASGYESVVLSPECFLRFNDNILQACFLRAAHPHELDYSASPDLSKLMKEFLLKVFQRHSHKFGDASLEFAAALAVGSLKLSEPDTKVLISTAISIMKDVASPLLGFLVMAHIKHSN